MSNTTDMTMQMNNLNRTKTRRARFIVASADLSAMRVFADKSALAVSSQYFGERTNDSLRKGKGF